MTAAIERGVNEFVDQRKCEEKPVGFFRVALIDISVHPVDSRELPFTRAAILALTQAFKEHEVFIEK